MPKKRKVGTGMNPRPGQEVKNVSTVEVQTASILEPVLSRVGVEPSSNRLDPEKVQNLESEKEPTVADSDAVLSEISEPIQAPEDLISELMKPTESIVAVQVDDLEAAMALVKAQVVDPQMFLRPPVLIGGAIMQEAVIYSSNDQIVGNRQDGTFGIVVTIPEGYIGPIRDQAESDGITPEKWVSDRLVEYCESWWQPATGR